MTKSKRPPALPPPSSRRGRSSTPPSVVIRAARSHGPPSLPPIEVSEKDEDVWIVSMPPPVFIGSPVRVESTKISADRMSLRLISDERSLKANLSIRGDGVNVSLKVTADREMTEAEGVAVLRWCRAQWPSPRVLRTLTLQIK
jgi:hypothetical protein